MKKKFIKTLIPTFILGGPAIAISSFRSFSQFKNKQTVSFQKKDLALKENDYINPFSAFENNTKEVNHLSDITHEGEALLFLENENLLHSTEKQDSLLSGEIDYRKEFSQRENCVAGAVYNNINLAAISYTSAEGGEIGEGGEGGYSINFYNTSNQLFSNKSYSSQTQMANAFNTFDNNYCRVPTLTGVPTDIVVTQDTLSNIDLSSLIFDDAQGDSLTVTLTVSAGVFSIPNNGSGLNVTASKTSDTVVTLSGLASNINTYLDTASNIKYTPANGISGEDKATITISATDGSANLISNPSINIDITAVNNAPVTTLPAAPTIHEDGTDVAFADTIQIADSDSDNQTVTLTATNGTLSLTTTGLSFTTGDGTDDATMTFSGTLAAVNTALDSLTFSPTADYDGSASLRVQTDDGNGGTDDDTLNLTVLDAPEITSIVRGTPSAQNTNADSLTFYVYLDSNITTDATIADFEVIGTTTATVTSVTRQSIYYEVVVSGGDLASFNGSVGLKFVDDNSVLDSNNVPIGGDGIDHFTTGETYTINTTAPTPNLTSATDNVGSVTGGLSSGDTTDDTSLLLAGTNENGSTVKVYNGTTLLGSAIVSGTSWTYSATIVDGTTYNFNVKETDSAGNESSATSNFTITGDTTAPTIAITSDKDALKVGETAIITFTLSEASSNFDSTDVSVSGGAISNFASISSTVYTATFTPTDNSTTNGTISVNGAKFTDAAGNDNTTATPKTIDTVVPNVTISTDKNSAINGELVNLTFTLSKDSSNFTVDDITVSGGTINNFAQDNTNSKVYTAQLTIDNTTTTKATLDINAGKFEDASGNPNSAASQKTITILPSVLTYTPSLDATDIELNSTLVLEFSEELVKGTGNILIKKYGDDSVVETIDVTSSNVVIENPNIGNNLTNTKVTITRDIAFTLNTQYYIMIPNTAFKDVEDNFYQGISSKDSWKFTYVDNHAPTIKSNTGGDTATISVDENQTAVTTVVASDVDNGQTITYSISGTNATSFNIDSSTGVLTFKTAPNYEVKNSYGVIVTATDDGGNTLSDSQTLTVNINDVNDEPTINIDSSLTTNEDNQKDLVYTYTDEDGNTVSALEKTAPTYGTILISGTTITYTPNVNFNGNDSFVVTLSDNNGFSVDKTISVTVNPVDDAPVISTILDNQSENEDGKDLVISLSTTDIDDDLNATPATYSVTSSDENIAIAYIKDGNLIVVPKPNANGTVTITVTTTVNGKSTSKSFTYTLVSVNDAPTISNIAAISHDQSSSAITKTITFDIWDDVDVTSLSATSSNTNLLANSDISVSKLSSTQGQLTYTISANNAGTTIVEVVARDVEGLEYNESFNINVKASNDALCVEDTKTALVFDTIKQNNISQDSVTSNLDLINSIDTVCSSTITWSISDTSVLDINGIVTQDTTEKTITATANIVKGLFSAEKVFLITIPSSAISDSEALDKLLFETIKGDNEGRYQIISKLNLIDTILGKTITWSVDDDSVISPYSGYVTRGSTDNNIMLTAKIGTQTKTFNLTVLKEETSNLDKVKKDKELLTMETILGLNKDSYNVIYNLIKPLPSLGANGSTITWSSSNTDYITNDGDVLRDENADKYVVLTATITNGSETTTKDFILKVLQNKIETNDGTTFKSAINTGTGTNVTTTKNSTDTTTSASFTNTILNIVEQVVSQDSINSIIEFAQKVVNVYLNTDGTSQTTFQGQDGTTSSIQTKTKGSNTSVDDSGNVTTTNGSVTLKLNSDGSVEHQVTNGALNSKANSTIPSSNVKEDESGNVETTSEVTQDGFVYKAVVTTNPQGETTTKFIKVDLTTGEQSELDKTTSDTTPYQAGNQVEISQINGVLYIKTTAPLDGSIVIE